MMKRLVSPSVRRLSWPSVVRVALLWSATVALVSAQSLSASGRVQRVIDGDTLVVTGIGTVRLIDVDTPETVDPRKVVQFYGQEASAFTKHLAEGQTVRLEFEGSRKDRYDRTRAYVYLKDGSLLNADLIREGYGFAYTQYPFSRLEEFRQLERDARSAGRGLWGPAGASAQRSPTAPAVVSAALERTPNDATETVYATRTGTKYHRAGCRHLARSQIPMTLKDASARYQPCKVCRPPVLSSVAPLVAAPVAAELERARPATAVPATAVPARPASVSPAVSSGRCQATTKKGTQCSRKAQAGRSFCWQH